MSDLAQTVRGVDIVADVSSLEAALARMDADLAVLRARRDRTLPFLLAYRYQTEQMKKNVLAGRFADPAWVMRVNVKRIDLIEHVPVAGVRRALRRWRPAFDDV